MALRHAVMAALLEGEASGYDLAKGFDASVANFWMATPQQVYRELEKMEADGLISARIVEQERRPNKRLFSLTETGHETLRRFIAAPAKPGAIREELLVKVQAVDAGDPEAVEATLARRLEFARAKLAGYDRLRDRLLDGRTEEDYVRSADRIGPYLTLMRGRAFEQENIQWMERSLEILRLREKR
ncbi:PadR family transcriptional regulator [Lentzea sp. NBRC 105346]|uniref:PadR family transcriptional regulator n=1 Tax=Lentzea sp. NBRC 105346 TaxID=3032205 RepID=UPI0024A4C36E|nr:PadR family transcriptional regulator [Lentzea sp. NBRC 105346]GLZ30076.1 PadR family transcriptional regulator [Lentzea sp. NBRC 105346]